MTAEYKFRGQFLLTPDKLTAFGGVETISIKGYNLYTHEDLSVAINDNERSTIVILGDLYDYKTPRHTNQDIVDEIARSGENLLKTIDLLGRYCGIFTVLYHDKISGDFSIFGDAACIQEVFIFDKGNSVAIGSQPTLLKEYYNLQKDESPEALAFYSSSEFLKKKAYVGDLTEYLNVKRLKPNHYLDLDTREIHRFYPVKKLSMRPLKQVAKAAGDMLKGYLEAMSLRKKLLLPVSAGWESRVLLAASKNFTERCHYYVFKDVGHTDQHPDVQVPSKLMPQLGLEIDVIDRNRVFDESKSELINASLSFPRKETLSYIFGNWSKFADHTAIIGNVSEVARMEFDDIANIDEYKVAVLQRYPTQPYAINYYKKWIEENAELFKRQEHRILDMLYWEENCCNWVGKAATESKLVISYQLPFNSRDLLITMMGVNKKYRKKQYCILYKEIVDYLYPECLKVAVNPGIKKSLIYYAQRIGFYSAYRNLLMGYTVKKAKSKMAKIEPTHQ